MQGIHLISRLTTTVIVKVIIARTAATVVKVTQILRIYLRFKVRMRIIIMDSLIKLRRRTPSGTTISTGRMEVQQVQQEEFNPL